jgi:hypothetical protein
MTSMGIDTAENVRALPPVLAMTGCTHHRPVATVRPGLIARASMSTRPKTPTSTQRVVGVARRAATSIRSNAATASAPRDFLSPSSTEGNHHGRYRLPAGRLMSTVLICLATIAVLKLLKYVAECVWEFM